MVRGLISERSYPLAVKPAGLNGSIRHQLSGEGSGGELERCLRWGSRVSAAMKRMLPPQLGQRVPSMSRIPARRAAHVRRCDRAWAETSAVGSRGL